MWICSRAGWTVKLIQQSSDLRNVVNRGVDGILQLVFEYGAEFREGFVIGAWISFSTGVRVWITRATILRRSGMLIYRLLRHRPRWRTLK